MPANRLSRIVSFGTLAAGLGVGAVAEVSRRTFGKDNTSGGQCERIVVGWL